tara:strand:+ start:969 stop:1397 length:429 start_codon:yes stop_codon:yes gene_type:complete
MKIKLIFLGKKRKNNLDEITMGYFKRIQKEINSEIIFISDQKKIFLNFFKENDLVILIDEKGKHFDSISFSKKFKMLIQNSKKKIIFIVGDANGFSSEIYNRSNEIISLSKFTFTHEIARLIIVEQIYRAITIIKNHPYHNE